MSRFRVSHSLLLLFVLQFYCRQHASSVSGQCLSDQKTLLLQLRDSLILAPYSVSTKIVDWELNTEDCCFWGGVTCDSAGHVVGLDLSQESIIDGINENSSLFDLRFLQRLSLAGNYFGYYESAQLPSNFEKLTSLEYLNLSDSGFTGLIPSTFSRMTNLVSLDLSIYAYFPNTDSSRLEIPNLEDLVQNLTMLRELYLEGINFSAQGLAYLCRVLSSSVPDLQVLRLSNCYLSGPIDYGLAKLKSLSVIRLDHNKFSGQIPGFFADFANLTVLSLSTCGLSGVTPEKIFQVPTLQTIDLSNNGDLLGSLPEFPADSSLQNLLLRSTQFSGSLPDSIGNLKMLSKLDLTGCNFTGRIPTSVESLANLFSVDLSSNYFNGSVPSFNQSRDITVINLGSNNLSGNISFFRGVTLDYLEQLDLSQNSLEGQVPANIFFMPSLRILRLNSNKFSSQISEAAASKQYSSKLEIIDLQSNNLEGPVPQFLFDLHNLTSLTLSWNQFNGTLELINFGKLQHLVSLELSYNNLVIDTNSTYSDQPSLLTQFDHLMLASCGIKTFPFLQNQSKMMMLDLSNDQIAGEIPSWLWDVGDRFLLRFLNLSHNQLTHFQEPFQFGSLDFLDLHSNFLTGQLPIPPITVGFVDFSSNNFSSIPADIGNHLPNALYLSIANNMLVGSIPESLCNASSLQVLNLSNNTLSNTIPPCLLENSNFLGVLNLGRNNLSGYIPEISFPNCTLETFDLSWNNFEGKLPTSLSNCSSLKVLNLGNNRMDDYFPCWLNNLTSLHVLVLRNNHFYGSITCPGNHYSWPNLQIVDLAVNNFSGAVPRVLLSSLNAMAVKEDDPNAELNHLKVPTSIGGGIYYQDSVSLILKGQATDIQKILNIFTSIDFSSNHFQGNVPETIGDLQRLYLLNFSHNAFAGSIPQSIGNLKELGSLDLSFNHLGEDKCRHLQKVASWGTVDCVVSLSADHAILLPLHWNLQLYHLMRRNWFLRVRSISVLH